MTAAVPPAHLSRELDVATALAREAMAVILRVKDEARRTATEKPGGQGPVTAADLAADGVLRDGLTRAFPRDLVVSEETWPAGATVPAAHRAWFCDPLDGTRDFVLGRADYAVMIGLCVWGRPCLGVIAQPETGRVWRGTLTARARRCERIDDDGRVTPLSVARRRLPRAGPRAAVSRSHPSRLSDKVLDVLGGGSVVKKGSVGLKIALIVDDEADLYVTGSRRIKVWDTAGPQAILEAAGGSMTALDGSPLVYDDKPAHLHGVLAWTPAAARALQRRVDEAVAVWRGG